LISHQDNNLKIIGLTGGIGTGKSTVAKFLAELGAEVVDLDTVGHQVLAAGSRGFQQTVAVFGRRILTPDGEIDRSKLGTIVFKDPRALQRLNNITHPIMDEIVNEKIAGCRRQGVKVLVIEAAALIEAGRRHQVDELWVTVAPQETVLRRLHERSGYSPDEARTRINSQLSDEERVRQADVVIDTDCTLDELKARVAAEWQKLLKRL
jgi:dephospho-CoA kinase